ncbi:MAG: VOC family protein [Xanthomonadales bacterium]|nr:VOC family protein [Xanthomonadales bacterium]MCB1641424.1 VOC family protein [Xanthomonadales bacterium]
MIQYGGFVPYLYYDDAAQAIDWYTRVFGFEEIARWSGSDGRVRNAEMRAGTAELWLDGGGRKHLASAPEIWIGVWVDDVHAVHERVTGQGVPCDPPVDRDFGIRMLNVSDGMGHSWGFMSRF